LTVDGVAGAITKSVLRGAVTGVTPVQPIAVPSSASVNWSSLAASQRTLYVMELLINTYHFPLSGAAGLVGNLLEESGLIPNRVEGSKPNTPMRSGNFHGVQTDFSAIDIMNRNASSGIGPRLPGIGIAQWTTASRRQGLFQYSFGGQQPGTAIIFNMDAQVDYLVNELKTKYSQVYHFITAGGISLNDASDEVVYRFEVPGSVLSSGKPRHLLPRSDAQVQRIFARRRQSAQHAFSVYKIAHP
jgi:hypothetical protein